MQITVSNSVLRELEYRAHVDVFSLAYNLFFDGCKRCYCAVTALLARYLSAVYGLLLRCYPAIAGLNQPENNCNHHKCME